MSEDIAAASMRVCGRGRGGRENDLDARQRREVTSGIEKYVKTIAHDTRLSNSPAGFLPPWLFKQPREDKENRAATVRKREVPAP
jgi:hypothetical protein